MTRLTHNTEIDGVRFMAGVGPLDARIMIITTCVTPEEYTDVENIGYGKTTKRIPRIMDCPQGVLLKDIALSQGVDLDKCYCVPVIRYLPENISHRTRPTKAMLTEAWEWLKADIERIKPQIIVCMGKPAFDLFVSFRIKADDVRGVWFYQEEFHARLYLAPAINEIFKPEKHASFVQDFAQIAQMDKALQGHTIQHLPINYKVIHNISELLDLVNMLEAEQHTILSVDCEWEGHQYVDGKLRSLQIAWSETDAAYIRFMDDALNYAFDVDYAAAGQILGIWCNRPEVKYIGHHISADLPWMCHWLKLDWYGKAIFDTEFALQTCDESADLGLDAVALRYTTLGRYDWDLIWWRKNHPEKRGNGYGQVPDEILIPYGIKDVITVWRAYEPICNWLKAQKLWDYYNDLLNPFVTDVFTSFAINGIPMDVPKMDHMRELYQWARAALEVEFREMITQEAAQYLTLQLFDKFDTAGLDARNTIVTQVAEGKTQDAYATLKALTGAERYMEVCPLLDHYIDAPSFNLRSKTQMVRWLFAVKGYTPIKSTANKAAGSPSMDWSKVLAMPAAKRGAFTPASDKQTLEILAAQHKDATISALLELNAVGNICKAFLRPAEIDEETGEVIAEKGLHYWVSSKSAAHLMTSLTETGRPRSWNPNTLNWPSWIHGRLGKGVVRIIKLHNERGTLPAQFEHYVGMESKQFPSIRSACMAPEGWCMVECDYQTAEMRGLAFISGCSSLIKLILEPDTRFAKIKPECLPAELPPGVDRGDCVIRVSFPEYITIPNNLDQYLMSWTVGGKTIFRATEDMLLRDDQGQIVSPKFDIHWGVVELAQNTAREVLDAKRDRGGGKVANFSSTYGATAASIERKIEADIGVKPEEGAGDKLLSAIERRQPRATEFLKEMERAPAEIGYLRAASGRVRHCVALQSGVKGLGRTREAHLAALGRECRNFMMQESVGATAARACIWLLRLQQVCGLRGYPMICLYDSVVILCPDEEREIWKVAQQLYMFACNGWEYHGRVLRYPIDTELNAGWSTKPDAARKKQLSDPEWKPTPPELQYVLDWLKDELQKYLDNEWLSVGKTSA